MKEKNVFLVLLLAVLLISGCGGGGSSPPPAGIIRYGVQIISNGFNGNPSNNYVAMAFAVIDGQTLDADISVNDTRIPVDNNEISIGLLNPGDQVSVSITHPKLSVSATLRVPGIPEYITETADLNNWFHSMPRIPLIITWTDEYSKMHKSDVYIKDEKNTIIAQESWKTTSNQMVIDETKSASLLSTPGAAKVMVRVYGYDEYIDTAHDSDITIVGESVDIE